MNKNRGFTLIELLVVVVVIGILAGIVFVTIGDIPRDARNSRRRSDMRTIHLAMEMYRINIRRGVGYMAITSAPITPAPPTPGNRLTTIAIGEILNPIPLDPSNTGDFIYRAFASPVGSTEFCIWARMEGIAPGTAGAVVAASERGVRDMAAAPASLIACP
ncbi:MAG: prepilin-type N-terminal cleavage/methylation domain-containing protein [Candidatus Nealsonbacteria bacterium]|nr:prepilin-type N-terminal cleavage/methylation domain-containing protein [Candidatus Nealsonbacteria bacterium]